MKRHIFSACSARSNFAITDLFYKGIFERTVTVIEERTAIKLIAVIHMRTIV